VEHFLQLEAWKCHPFYWSQCNANHACWCATRSLNDLLGLMYSFTLCRSTMNAGGRQYSFHFMGSSTWLASTSQCKLASQVLVLPWILKQYEYGQPFHFTHHQSYDVLNLLIVLADKDLLELRKSKGKYAWFLCDVCKFYLDWHVKSYGSPGKLKQ
jgi:hypothetical protein